MKSVIPFKAWTKKEPPRKILAIRLQAMGDTVLTLPYLLSLRKQLGATELHFLTREEVADIPHGIELFDRVISIKGGRDAKAQLLYCILLMPLLWRHRYDVVIDLQNNKISQVVRTLLRPHAWSAFDRYSPRLAGERTRLTIDAVKVATVQIETDFGYKALHLPAAMEEKLAGRGWVRPRKIIIINPAGAFESRHWPMENYEALCRLWLAYDPESQFAMMGLASLTPKAHWLKERMGHHLIDLTGDTNVMEAFVLVKLSYAMVTEDSGLMHMSWVQGVPTLALFGSTRSDWSAPMGVRSHCLNSSDLACGHCMQPLCEFGDNRCLTRYTPEFVFQELRKLVRPK